MTFTYLFHLSRIICLNIFSEFFSFIQITTKLSILLNQAKHPKELALCYMLLFFTMDTDLSTQLLDILVNYTIA